MSRLLTTLATFGILTMTAALGGCLSPYRMEMAQGNIVTQEMVDQLRPGMTRSQVRFILGTPMIADPFHADRWDYYYSLRRSTDTEPQTQHIAVIFNKDLLARVEGNVGVKGEGATSPNSKGPGS